MNEDMWYEIMLYLDYPYLISQVCKLTYKIINRQDFWQIKWDNRCRINSKNYQSESKLLYQA